MNAWTEIVGIAVATSAALVLYTLFSDAREEYLLLGIVGIAMPAALAACSACGNEWCPTMCIGGRDRSSGTQSAPAPAGPTTSKRNDTAAREAPHKRSPPEP